MPRRARLLLAGSPHHIVQRGHNRQCCFFQQSDYRMYLDWVDVFSKFFGVRVHSYVLMTNHVHLLVSMDEMELLASFMKSVAQHYAQYLNRRLDRTGAWWGGRYYSCPVPTEHYILACQRYIELNPVRAGLVLSPEQYLWSSYCANAGLRRDSLVTHHAAYMSLSENAEARRSVYRGLFRRELEAEELWQLRKATAANLEVGKVPEKASTKLPSVT
jgi:putative transposase